jgi:proteasome lid subunit RPN8/RPN11
MEQKQRALPPDLSPVVRHLEAMYPQEGCGVVLWAEQGDSWCVRPLTNAYDRYHALDPVRFPRTSRTAYLFEPREWLLLLQQAEAQGEQVVCVFHSHVNGIADFSAEDRAQAAPEGQPLLPGVAYLVVAVEAGRATHARLFWWENEDFRDRPVPL